MYKYYKYGEPRKKLYNAEDLLIQLQKESTDLLNFVSDETAFRLNYKNLVEEVYRKSYDYNTELVKATFSILLTNPSSPAAKFNALLLLLRVSETRDKVILNHLVKRQDILSHILNAATSDITSPIWNRGMYYFTKEPDETDAIYGKKYVRLAGECIAYWDAEFGSEDPNNPFQIFTFNYQKMKRRGVDYKEFQYARSVPRLRAKSKERYKSPSFGSITIGEKLKKVPDEQNNKIKPNSVSFAHINEIEERERAQARYEQEQEEKYKRLEEKTIKPIPPQEWLELWRKDRGEKQSAQVKEQEKKTSKENGTSNELTIFSTPILETHGSSVKAQILGDSESPLFNPEAIKYSNSVKVSPTQSPLLGQESDVVLVSLGDCESNETDSVIDREDLELPAGNLIPDFSKSCSFSDDHTRDLGMQSRTSVTFDNPEKKEQNPIKEPEPQRRSEPLNKKLTFNIQQIAPNSTEKTQQPQRLSTKPEDKANLPKPILKKSSSSSPAKISHRDRSPTPPKASELAEIHDLIIKTFKTIGKPIPSSVSNCTFEVLADAPITTEGKIRPIGQSQFNQKRQPIKSENKFEMTYKPMKHRRLESEHLSPKKSLPVNESPNRGLVFFDRFYSPVKMMNTQPIFGYKSDIFSSTKFSVNSTMGDFISDPFDVVRLKGPRILPRPPILLLNENT